MTLSQRIQKLSKKLKKRMAFCKKEESKHFTMDSACTHCLVNQANATIKYCGPSGVN